MATIAELAVNFTANTGGLDSGVGRATGALQRFKTEAEKASYAVDQEFGRLNKSLSAIGINGSAVASSVAKVGLAMVGLSAGAGLAVMVGMFDKSVESAAKLQEMSEKTGASIEKLSGIAQIAKIEGADMDAVSSAMAKLAVNMEASGGASKKMSDALGRIGLSLSDLKGKDTGSMFEMISRSMSKYGESAGKTAVAVELFGKRGAELIPTMNLLGESGALVVKTTEQQALQADAYEKNVKRLQLSKDALYKTISMSLLPTVNAFVESMIDVNNETDGARKAVKGLAEDGSLKEWSIVSGYALAGLADTFSAVGKAAMTVGMTISTPISAMFKLINGEAEASANKIASFKTRMDELWGGKSFVTRFGEKLDNPTATGTGNKSTIGGGNTGSVANKSGDSFISSLNARLTKGIGGEYAQLMQQADDKGVTKQAAALIEQIRTMDEGVSLKNYTKSLQLATDEYRAQIDQLGMTKEQIELINVDHKMTVDLQKQIEQIERSKGALTAETRAEMENQKKSAVETVQSLIKIRQESERSIGGGATRAINNYMDAAGNVGKQVETTFTNAFKNMEDAMVQFAITGKMNFTNFANSVVADIMRIYVRMAITGLIGKVGGMFAAGATGSTGQDTRLETGGAMSNMQANGGAWLGGVQKFASGGVFNSPHLFPMANGGTGMLGEAGPEAVMPLTRGSDGKLGVRSSGGGSVVQVNIVNNGASDGYQASASQSTDSNGNDMITVLIDKVKGAMSQDVRNNGQFTRLLSSKYGLAPKF